MSIREIKEMVMRTASHLEQAEQKLTIAFMGASQHNNLSFMLIGCLPIFGQDFQLDIRNSSVIQYVTQLGGVHLQPSFNFNGLERQLGGRDISSIQLRRNGLILLKRILPSHVAGAPVQNYRPVTADVFLRRFVKDSANIYTNASLNGPFLLGMKSCLNAQTQSLYPSAGYGEEEGGGAVPPADYPFPMMQADNLIEIDRITRPLCDQVHQMFGRKESPCFNGEGVWVYD
jgi:hypothetical protein